MCKYALQAETTTAVWEDVVRGDTVTHQNQNSSPKAKEADKMNVPFQKWTAASIHKFDPLKKMLLPLGTKAKGGGKKTCFKAWNQYRWLFQPKLYDIENHTYIHELWALPEQTRNTKSFLPVGSSLASPLPWAQWLQGPGIFLSWSWHIDKAIAKHDRRGSRSPWSVFLTELNFRLLSAS